MVVGCPHRILFDPLVVVNLAGKTASQILIINP